MTRKANRGKIATHLKVKSNDCRVPYHKLMPMMDVHAYEEEDFGVENQNSTSFGQKFKKGLKDNLFTILTLIGVAIGFGIGFGVGTTQPSKTAVTWIEMPGKIYIRLLQLTILPIIASNIIVVTGGIDPRKNGKMGLAGLLFILGFDIISGAIGVIIAVLIKPGLSTSISVNETVEEPGPDDAPVLTSDVFADLFLNMFPDNIVGLTLYQTKTIRRWPYFPVKNVTESASTRLESTDMIGLIFTTIAFGIAAGAAGEAGRVFIDFFESLGNVVLILMRWFLQITPVGVCFMVAGAVVDLKDVSGTFQGLGLFMATVLVALAIHMLLQMAVYAIASFRNPFRLIIMGSRVFFLSFITTAPVIAIPEMIDTCDRYGLQKKITRFVIPLSTALKGDASGVFQAVACVFIAQLTGFQLTAGTYVLIALLTGFATLAIPNIPSSSIVIIITILSSIGVRTGEVSLLFAVEWLMDRCRSGSLGLGHLFAAAFTHSVAVGKRTEGEVDEENELHDFDEDEYQVEKSD
ncbi:Excitatory amino acid transporter 2 [Echinococcus granulosus]|nr:Excitatory amino acid transporter 2 [Echinococcus granulosus]